MKNQLSLTVVRRDGSSQPFDLQRIEKAVSKGFAACQKEGNPSPTIQPDQIAREVTGLILTKGFKTITLEEIQDMVEARLVYHRLYDQAKAYMIYRSRHQELRDLTTAALDIGKTMNGYLGQSDWRVQENANVNYSLGGLILHNSGAITANYWLSKIYSTDISQAHTSAAIHIHDLSMFSGYCAGWSLGQLITEGLGGVKDKISSAPARHLMTLIQQIVNFLGIMQNEWAGAQAFSSFDTYLAPFVRIDSLGYKEVKQSIQSFLYGVNTPSRWGSQAPFTNITLDWVVPSDLAQQPAIVAGVPQNFTYGECQAEMDLINRAFLELMIDGDANGRGFQYPIPTYNITKEFCWDTPNAQLLFTMTAKYGTPYFQNFINSDLNPSDVRSMCCRLQLDKRELRKRGGGLFGSDEFTGSIGVVTINLPQIGYLAKDKQDFFHRLDRLMIIAKDSLETKRTVIQKLMDQGLFPYTKRYLSHLNNHFSTIGIVGMNEALQNFCNRNLLDEQGRDLALEILDHMQNRLAEFQNQTGQLYNLEASPAEGTSYRLALHDQKNFRDIITAGTPEAPYYTNSTQLPVGATEDIFQALILQDDLQSRYTGGTVFHGFLGESINDWEPCRELVRTIANSFRLPYFTISPTYSICEDHGYLAGEQLLCPHCGRDAEVYSRIVGYYRSLNNWNKGKNREYHERLAYHHGSNLGNVDSIERHPSESKGATNQLDFALFTTESCPRCPLAKQVLIKSSIPFTLWDAHTPEGERASRDNNIPSVPTLVCYDQQSREELWRCTDVNEMERKISDHKYQHRSKNPETTSVLR